MKLFIDAGHSTTIGKDRGAAGPKGRIEGLIVAKFRTDLVAELKKRGIHADVDPDDLKTSETLKFLRGKTSPDTILISYHCNSAGPTATGVETFVDDNPITKELILANLLSKATAELMGIPLRGNTSGYAGVKKEKESQHDGLGWMRLPGINVLHEFFFISNEKEGDRFEAVRIELICRHADVIEKFMAEYQGFKDELTVGETKYKVRSGDSLSKIAKEFNVTVAFLRDVNGLKSDTILVGQELIVK